VSTGPDGGWQRGPLSPRRWPRPRTFRPAGEELGPSSVTSSVVGDGGLDGGECETTCANS
jgi:hypothetical protein